MQDSLGGNSKTLMLVACRSEDTNTSETVSQSKIHGCPRVTDPPAVHVSLTRRPSTCQVNSLTFATRAKSVKLGKAKVRAAPEGAPPPRS